MVKTSLDFMKAMEVSRSRISDGIIMIQEIIIMVLSLYFLAVK